MSTYRILTLNIHKGFSAGNRTFTLERIRDCLRASDANAVFLQEVVGENEKKRQQVPGWPDSNQLEYLADSL
jgi:endonuclease/exonuclease/phosphatase family metal-dependent hydrolase